MRYRFDQTKIAKLRQQKAGPGKHIPSPALIVIENPGLSGSSYY